MTSASGLDWFLAILCLVLSVFFFIGKGQAILDAFSGKNYKKKKMNPEQNRKYQTATGIFLLILGVDEIFMALIPSTTMGIISIFVSIAALVGMIIYIRKMLGD